jgi:hypothetical protein
MSSGCALAQSGNRQQVAIDPFAQVTPLRACGLNNNGISTAPTLTSPILSQRGEAIMTALSAHRHYPLRKSQLRAQEYRQRCSQSRCNYEHLRQYDFGGAALLLFNFIRDRMIDLNQLL